MIRANSIVTVPQSTVLPLLGSGHGEIRWQKGATLWRLLANLLLAQQPYCRTLNYSMYMIIDFNIMSIYSYSRVALAHLHIHHHIQRQCIQMGESMIIVNRVGHKYSECSLL